MQDRRPRRSKSSPDGAAASWSGDGARSRALGAVFHLPEASIVFRAVANVPLCPKIPAAFGDFWTAFGRSPGA